MKLIINNVSLDTQREIELLPYNKELGFTVKLKFTNGEKETCNNVTEVHYLYKSLGQDKRVACESDIHGTGCTFDINKIDSIEVLAAMEVSENF